MTVKAIGINEMFTIVRKQTHGVYPQSNQLITMIFGPISGKYGWKRRRKLTCDLESRRWQIEAYSNRVRIEDKAKGWWVVDGRW